MSITQNVYDRLVSLGFTPVKSLVQWNEIRFNQDYWEVCFFQKTMSGTWTFAPRSFNPSSPWVDNSENWITSGIPNDSKDTGLILDWIIENLKKTVEFKFPAQFAEPFKPRVIYPAEEQQELCL